MERVAVLGCGGAGKTTFARALGEATGLPVIHGDDHRAEWEGVHDELIGRDAWIIDAMRYGTIAPRLDRADTAIFLDLSPWTCLRGVLARRKEQPLTFGLLWWIAKFPFRHRGEILRQLEERTETLDVYILRSHADADRFIRAEERLSELRARRERPRAA